MITIDHVFTFYVLANGADIRKIAGSAAEIPALDFRVPHSPLKP
jgi:hypothetical protein